MKGYRLISSNYDAETGISTATIATPDGLFTATSHLSKEDKDIESSFAGCRNAEAKAYLNWYRYRYKLAVAAYDALKKLDDALRSSRKFNPYTYEYKHVDIQLWRARIKKEKLEKQIQHMQENYLKISDYRNKMISKKFNKDKNN